MTSVYSLIGRTFVESAHNLTPEKSQGGRKAQHITVTNLFGDHARSCLTLAFESECSCSVPNDFLSLSFSLVLNFGFRERVLLPCAKLLFSLSLSLFEGRVYLYSQGRRPFRIKYGCPIPVLHKVKVPNTFTVGDV